MFQFVCDNQGVVEVLCALYSRDEKLMHLLRCLVFTAAKFNFWFTAIHIPGAENVLADALSRGDNARFHSQAPLRMNCHPDIIPEEIPLILYRHQPDWLSKTWNQLFKNITQRV